MHDYVNGLKNWYAAAEAIGYKFPMGTALLIKCMKDSNPGVDNSDTL